MTRIGAEVVEPVRLAVAGVGNNISALFQGAELYREMAVAQVAEPDLPGIKHPRIGGLSVSDLRFVAAFDVHPGKVGVPFHQAVLSAPNNYPRLDVELPDAGFAVDAGLAEHDVDASSPAFVRVVERLRETGAEVLLYSLPTGLQWAASAYARAALHAGVAFVNCTPELVARSPELLADYQRAGVPLLGDDLASHLGTSVVHRALLGLLSERGLTLASSYQLNFGGNEDFRNLRERGATKRESKLNALAQEGVDTSNVEVIPSAGFVAHLGDNKVAMVNIEGLGWAGTPVSLDLKLKVQDSSNAAGVIIDLVRIAASSRRRGIAGFPAAAATVLKSPPGGHALYPREAVLAGLRELDAPVETLRVEAGGEEHRAAGGRDRGRTVRVALLAYEAVDELDLFGAYAVLAKAQGGAGRARSTPALEVRITAATPRVLGSGGVVFDAQAGTEFLARADAVVVPGGRGAPAAAADPTLRQALRAAAERGAALYGICTGVLLIAAAGLADGRRVAVHHAKRDLLDAYPVGEVVEGLVRDGQVTSVGGDVGASVKSVDLAFRVVADYAPEAVAALRARLEVSPGRWEGAPVPVGGQP